MTWPRQERHPVNHKANLTWRQGTKSSRCMRISFWRPTTVTCPRNPCKGLVCVTPGRNHRCPRGDRQRYERSHWGRRLRAIIRFQVSRSKKRATHTYQGWWWQVTQCLERGHCCLECSSINAYYSSSNWTITSVE